MTTPQFIDPEALAAALNSSLVKRFELTVEQLRAYTGAAKVVLTVAGDVWVHQASGVVDDVDVIAAAPGKGGVWTRKAGEGGPVDTTAFATKSDLTGYAKATDLNSALAKRPVFSAAVQGSVPAAVTAAPPGATVNLALDYAGGKRLTAGLVTDGKRSFEGGGSNFVATVADASVTRSTDLLTVRPENDGNAYEFMRVDGVMLDALAGGRSALVIDTLEKRNIARALIQRSMFRADPAQGGFALDVLNETALPPFNPDGSVIRSQAPAFDALFCTTFLGNKFSGGVRLQNGGDSINWIGNTFDGPGRLDVSTLANVTDGGDSSQMLFIGNNVTPDGGTVFRKGKRFRWVFNNCELVPPGSGAYNNPLLHILGNNTTRVDSGVTHTGEVSGTTVAFNYLAGPSTQPLVVVEYCNGAYIGHNTIEQGYGDKYCLHIKSTARNTIVDFNLYQSGPNYEILDEGRGTMGVVKKMNAVALGAGRNFDASVGREGHFIKQPTARHVGLVTLYGSLSGGPIATGALLFVLPDGFRPAGTQLLVVHAVTSKAGVGGTVLQPITITVGANGEVAVFGTYANADTIVEVHFGGVTFPAPYV